MDELPMVHPGGKGRGGGKVGLYWSEFVELPTWKNLSMEDLQKKTTLPNTAIFGAIFEGYQ